MGFLPDGGAEGGDTVGITNADAFKRLFEGLYATELWSWSEEQFLAWLNSDYAGSAFPERLDLPICKCCGKPIDHLMVKMFAYDGIDSFVKTALTYIKEADFVAITTTRNWTGYQDGYIQCSMIDVYGCEECYRRFEERLDQE